MASLLPSGKQQFTDSAGAPLVGGKLYSYDAGTTTPRPTFADAAGTVPNTNPVVLDARGEATVFWSGVYKAVLRDADDVVVWTVDGMASADVLPNSLDAQLRADLASGTDDAKAAGQIAFDPRRNYVAGTMGHFSRGLVVPVAAFGAKGDWDGTAGTDDTAAIRNAIAFAELATDPAAHLSNTPYCGYPPTLLFHEGGNFKISDELVVTRRLHVQGGQHSEFSSGARLVQTARNKNTFTVRPAAGGSSFSIHGMTLKSATDGSGHLVEIVKEASGPGCNSQRYTSCTFANPQQMALKLIGDDILVQNCLFDVSTFSGDCIQLGGAGATEVCSNVRILGCDFYNIPTHIILLHRCYSLVFANNHISQTTTGSKTISVIDAYDTTPALCERLSITGNTIEGGRRLLAVLGGSDITFVGNTCTDDGIGTGETYDMISLAGGTQSVVIAGNILRGSYDTQNFVQSSGAVDVVVNGNAFINNGGGAEAIAFGSTTGQISGNDFVGFLVNVTAADLHAVGYVVHGLETLPYGASIDSNASSADDFIISATDNAAFTIQRPQNLSVGQIVRFMIRNTSGGALGAITWAPEFKLAGWVSPASGFSRSIEYRWDGTHLVERSRTTVDIPN